MGEDGDAADGVAVQSGADAAYERVRAEPANRKLVLEAVEQTRYGILHATADLKADREVALRSVRQCGDNLQLTPLRGDREVVLAAVQVLGDSIRWADTTLHSDREIVLAALYQDGLALRYAHEKLKDDHEVVLAAVRQNGRALRHASQRLRGDLDIVMVALQQHNAALAYVTDERHETAFAVNPEGFVIFQSLETLNNGKGDWQVQSKGGVRTIAVDGPNMYAVCEDNLVYRQVIVTMSPTSDWIGPLSGGAVKSVAIQGGFLFGVGMEDHRVYKQVLSQLAPEKNWDGPISDEIELSTVAIRDDQIYGSGTDGKLYRQNVYMMCNTSNWEGPMSDTLQVKGVGFFGDKVFAVGTDGRVYWQLVKDLHPLRQWTATKHGGVEGVVLCHRDMKDACRQMLEVEWRAKGMHLERRAAAAKVQQGG